MKLGNLLLAGAAASLSYYLVSNKEKIAQEVTETAQLIGNISEQYGNIQDQLAIIKSYQEPIQEMVSDFQYKLRVYQQEATAHLNEIQAIQEKYSDEKTHI